LANHQVLQSYYAQLYGLTSPAALPPFHQQYVGYMPSPAPPTPRAVLPPAAAPRVAAQAMMAHHPTPPQIQSPFLPVPSFQQDFRLQLPSHAVSILPPSTTGTKLLQMGVCFTAFVSGITYVLLLLKTGQVCCHLISLPLRLGRQAQAALRAPED
jgi:hypothetical protein